MMYDIHKTGKEKLKLYQYNRFNPNRFSLLPGDDRQGYFSGKTFNRLNDPQRVVNEMRATELRCDHKRDPIGIGGAQPLLSWYLSSDVCGDAQTAAQVQVSSAAGNWAEALVWDSGVVDTALNSMVYAGPAIASNAVALWRVRVWDARGCAGEWSEVACWRQGIAREDWRAAWIGYDEGRDAYDPTVPYYCADDFDKGENHPFLPKPALLRSGFRVEGDVASATLYVSAFGLTDVWINGQKATVGHMIPGCCDYRKRVYAFGYDVAACLRAGENAIAAVLADGWYAGYIGLNPRQWWGAKPRLSAQLHIEYRDGRRQTVSTDGAWRGCVGPWLYADIMHGAGYDATLEPAGWREPGYDDAAWHPVETGAEYDHVPGMHPGVPIVEHGRFAPKAVRRINGDEAIVDFGRCFSGVVSLRMRGPRGARIDLYHAEELERDGSELHFFGNRSAQAHDCYILSGEGEETFQPGFTYHGFRYAHLHGLGRIELLQIEGVAISSALPDPTELVSDDPTINDVIGMLRNTEQSNLYDMPTDVCARDERLGWGGDGHFFMHTAATLNHQALFLRKWLVDALDGQTEDGGFWAIAPAVMMKDIAPFVGDLQSNSAVHCAWMLARLYRDLQPVAGAFPALERYFGFMVDSSDRLLRFATGHDWLDLGHGGHTDADHGYGTCDPTLLGTAWFARQAQMMADIADSLGLPERAEHYRAMYGRIRAAFRTFFLGRNKRLRGATQAGYLLAAAFGLIEGDELDAARAWVIRDMDRCGGISWGTSAAAAALQGLCALGLEGRAAAFMRSTAYPSFGYMHGQGATAVWERWDSIFKGAFHPHAMNAFDHIGLAAAGAWLLERLAGIAPEADGYRRVRLQPVLDAGTGGMRARYHSAGGPIAVEWRFEAGQVRYRASIPTGVEGRLLLPIDQDDIRVVRGEAGIAGCHSADGRLAMDLRSGQYEFIIAIKNEEAKP